MKWLVIHARKEPPDVSGGLDQKFTIVTSYENN